jgi:hypothetical protein
LNNSRSVSSSLWCFCSFIMIMSCSVLHISSWGMGKYKKSFTSSISICSMQFFSVNYIICRRFRPVVEVVFFSITLRRFRSNGFFDILIFFIIFRNCSIKTLFRCFLPVSGSIRPLWVACGRSSMIFMLLFQLLSSFTAAGENKYSTRRCQTSCVLLHTAAAAYVGHNLSV